jgi:transcriptional regulator with XRE-family HTH domain
MRRLYIVATDVQRLAPMSTGQRVAYLRTRMGVTQIAFAHLTGLSHSYIDKLERGVRKLNTYTAANRLADTLGVARWLLTGTEAELMSWPRPAPLMQEQ